MACSVGRLARNVDSCDDLEVYVTGPHFGLAVVPRRLCGYRHDDTVLIVELDCALNVARMQSACPLFATPEGEIDQLPFTALHHGRGLAN